MNRTTVVGGLAAALAGLVWLVLTPFMATIWICDPICADWSAKPLAVATVGRWLAGMGAFTYAAPTDVYFDYGRFFPLFYLFATVAVFAFHGAQVRSAGAAVRPLLRWSFRAAAVGMVIAGLGDFASYTLGRYSEFLWSAGFGVEFFALAVLFPAMITYGVATLRQAALPRWTGWGLVAAGACIPLSLLDRWLVGYMPNAQLLALALFCFPLAASMLGGQPSMATTGRSARDTA